MNDQFVNLLSEIFSVVLCVLECKDFERISLWGPVLDVGTIQECGKHTIFEALACKSNRSPPESSDLGKLR